MQPGLNQNYWWLHYTIAPIRVLNNWCPFHTCGCWAPCPLHWACSCSLWVCVDTSHLFWLNFMFYPALPSSQPDLLGSWFLSDKTSLSLAGFVPFTTVTNVTSMLLSESLIKILSKTRQQAKLSQRSWQISLGVDIDNPHASLGAAILTPAYLVSPPELLKAEVGCFAEVQLCSVYHTLELSLRDPHEIGNDTQLTWQVPAECELPPSHPHHVNLKIHIILLVTQPGMWLEIQPRMWAGSFVSFFFCCCLYSALLSSWSSSRTASYVLVTSPASSVDTLECHHSDQVTLDTCVLRSQTLSHPLRLTRGPQCLLISSHISMNCLTQELESQERLLSLLHLPTFPWPLEQSQGPRTSLMNVCRMYEFHLKLKPSPSNNSHREMKSLMCRFGMWPSAEGWTGCFVHRFGSQTHLDVKSALVASSLCDRRRVSSPLWASNLSCMQWGEWCLS